MRFVVYAASSSLHSSRVAASTNREQPHLWRELCVTHTHTAAVATTRLRLFAAHHITELANRRIGGSSTLILTFIPSTTATLPTFFHAFLIPSRTAMPAQPRAGNSSGTLEHWPAAAPTGEGSCAITPRPSRLRLDQSSLPFEVPAIPAAAASHSRNASFAYSHSGSSSSHVATAHEASSSSLEAPSQQQHFYQQPRHYHCSVESYVEHVEDLAALAVPAVPALPALSMSSVAQAAAYPADAFTATTALQPAAAWPLHEGGIDEGAMGGQAGHSQRIASPGE